MTPHDMARVELDHRYGGLIAGHISNLEKAVQTVPEGSEDHAFLANLLSLTRRLHNGLQGLVRAPATPAMRSERK
jgi:hypothetical protein